MGNTKMNNSKATRKTKKKQELPSLLQEVLDAPDNTSFSLKPKTSSQYLGPIFLGRCVAYPHHPPPHSLKLGSFYQPQLSVIPGTDDISKLLLPPTKAGKQTKVIKPLKPKIKRQKTFVDQHLHRSPGKRKAFVPEVKPHVIDLGKTESIIEGETVMEIPICRLQKFPYPPYFKRKLLRKRDMEFVTPSDIREENRIYMSYKERIAHAHYPKEFATVQLIGPTIPASITIKKLPSKRRNQPELLIEAGAKVEEPEIQEVEEKGKGSDEVEEEEPKLEKSSEEETEETEKSDDHKEEKVEVEDIYEGVRETENESEILSYEEAEEVGEGEGWEMGDEEFGGEELGYEEKEEEEKEEEEETEEEEMEEDEEEEQNEEGEEEKVTEPTGEEEKATEPTGEEDAGEEDLEMEEIAADDEEEESKEENDTTQP